MAINKESNAYTIFFAVVMVVVVGGLLAFISTSLKPLQKANIKNEKMQNILQAIGDSTLDDMTREEAGNQFNDFVIKRIILDYDGNVIGKELTAQDDIDDKNTLDAFNVDMRKEYVAVPDIKERNYPLYVLEKDGKRYFVVSFSGKGLWDDIWGYIGIESDGATISGAIFDHKGETPGLGSKIAEDWFQDAFIGKSISIDGVFKALKVVKPKLPAELRPHEINGISGGTFTSIGVTEMLGRTLEVYVKYFKANPGELK